MIENQPSSSHSMESSLPVLQIPLDFGRRQQSFSYQSSHVTLHASLSRELKHKYGDTDGVPGTPLSLCSLVIPIVS